MEEYLTADQVAERLQLHARTVRRLLVAGELPGKKIGGKEWRVSAASLRAYIEGGNVSGGGAQKPAPDVDAARNEDISAMPIAEATKSEQHIVGQKDAHTAKSLRRVRHPRRKAQ